MVEEQQGMTADFEGSRQPEDIPVDDLLLDGENPRLASTAQGPSQEDLLRVLWTEMAVDEIALSIAANGFYQQEPLLVIPENPGEANGQRRKHIVVEGNRRLAAVLLLRDEGLRSRIKATNLPSIDADAQRALEKLPVLVYPDRQKLWAYLGFRHINGTQDWDAFSKARYVADVHEEFRVPLDEIARRIGDRHATVTRLYRGCKILEQAETQADFDKEDRVRGRFYFSHLYTATDQPEFQKFLGITSGNSLRPNPVPKSKLAALSELVIWLYGRKSTGTEPLVQTQNPDLRLLRGAIGKPAALSALRSGYSLQRAHEIGIGDKRRFRDALTSAKEELQQAKATVTIGYTGEEDLYTIASDMVRYAETVKGEMENIRARVIQQRG